MSFFKIWKIFEYVHIQAKVEKGFGDAWEAEKIWKWMERILF